MDAIFPFVIDTSFGVEGVFSFVGYAVLDSLDITLVAGFQIFFLLPFIVREVFIPDAYQYFFDFWYFLNFSEEGLLQMVLIFISLYLVAI